MNKALGKFGREWEFNVLLTSSGFSVLLGGKFISLDFSFRTQNYAFSLNLVMYFIQTNSALKNVTHLPSEVFPQPLTRAVTPAKSGGFGLRQGSFTGLMNSETFTQISEDFC